MKRSEVTESITKALNALPFSTETWLYGSEARGNAQADSDIDLLILVDSVSPETENDIFKADKDSKRQRRYKQCSNLDPGFLPKTHIYF